jgi:hypothetical protein
MQIQPVAQQPGKPALRSGAIIGIALGIIHSVITIMVTQMNTGSQNTYGSSSGPSPTTTILYLLTPLIWIIGFLIAGAWASKDTGKISTGSLAGLFAGTFGGVIAGLGQVVATGIAINQQSYNPGGSNLLLFSGFAAMFYVMALAIGAGAGLGALGGLIGQSMSKVRPQPVAQPAYAQPIMPYGYVQPQPMPMPSPQVPLPQQPEMPRLPEQ